MANLLFNPPPNYDLPLVYGQDVIIDFKNKVPGSDPAEFIAYAPGVIVSVVIQTDPPTVVVATQNADPEDTSYISGYHAVCYISAEVSDLIEKGIKWSCIVTIPGSPVPKRRVPTNGLTVRFDGEPVRR